MGEFPLDAPVTGGGGRPPAVAARRRLQVLLGLVWIADGALQLQPSMFTKAFVQGALLPGTDGNPTVVSAPIMSVAHLVAPHVALWNVAFAAIQLAIGSGLLLRRTVRPALAASLVWSLAVWWLAEGLGGLLTGTASPLTGAPGAALLYAVVAALAWPRRNDRAPGGDAASRAGLDGAAARLAWAVLWGGSAVLLLQPANLHPGAVKGVLDTAASGEPAWLSRPLLAVGSILGGRTSVEVTVALAAVMATVGLGVAVGWHERALLWTAVVLSSAVWVLGEAFGGVLTGSGTDPSTGPLLVLLALGLAPVRSARRRVPQPGRASATAPALASGYAAH